MFEWLSNLSCVAPRKAASDRSTDDAPRSNGRDTSLTTSNMSATTGNMDAVSFVPSCAAQSVARVSLHGPRLPGGRKFLGGAFSADGRWLLGVPACTRHVLRLDVTSGCVETLPGGEGKIPHGKFKWLRGIRAADGAVFCIPACGDGVLRISADGEVTILAVGTLPRDEWMWHGGALAADGCIYCIPANAPRVLRIDTVACTVSLIGPELQSGVRNKWYGGIKAHDGTIWGMPYNASTLLKIVPSTGEVVELGSFGVGDGTPSCETGWKWHGGSRSGNFIIGIPSHARHVLRIAPGGGAGGTDAIDLLGGPFDGRYKWGGATTDREGIVWAIPSDVDYALRIDPSSGEVAVRPFTPLPAHQYCTLLLAPVLHTDTLASRLSAHNIAGALQVDRLPLPVEHDVGWKNKWQGGVLGVDGNVYCIPCDASQVLAILPASRTLQLIGALPSTKKKFQGGAAAPDGTIWGLPESSEHILRIDVLGDAASGVGYQPPCDTPLWKAGPPQPSGVPREPLAARRPLYKR